MTDAFALVGPALRRLPPEFAHRLTVRALAAGLGGRQRVDDPALAQELWGLRFPNPIGLAAGFDKDAEAFAAMLALGMGFVEVGSVTPRAQPGNPRPRVFRLDEDRAVINRLGFNSAGIDGVRPRLERYRARARPAGVVGVNLGKNRTSEDAAADYAAGARALAPLADYLVVNVSSPNTPGLRALQGRAPLEDLLDAVRAALPAAPPPLLLKVAPDLGTADLADVAGVVLERGVDGVIIGNTTLSRPPELRSRHAGEAGGLSGEPLFRLSTDVLAELYRLTGGRVPLVGVGGVSGPDRAYAKIRAGASLIQLYTALVYQGPGLIGRIARGLVERLRADGFARLAEAVGADHR